MFDLTPEQKVKWLILQTYFDSEEKGIEITEDNLEDLYEEHGDDLQDAIYHVREGEVETEIEPDWDRHYESKSVAAKFVDGTWVGWTYWYGGGKHAEPEAIDWIDQAYDLDCVEEEKLVTVRTFTKK